MCVRLGKQSVGSNWWRFVFLIGRTVTSKMDVIRRDLNARTLFNNPPKILGGLLQKCVGYTLLIAFDELVKSVNIYFHV